MRHLSLLLLAIASIAVAQVPAPMADVNGVVDNTPDSIPRAMTARPVSGSTRRGDNPVLFLVGNSTMRTGTLGNGNNGQWGWGYFLHEYFDPARISVENHALGGMSTRTFYTRLWPDVLAGVRQGDYVIIELGHNDNGPYDSGRARATIPGTGRDSIEVTIAETGERETVYSHGEYLRRYIARVKQRGATPIIFSLTPRLAYDDRDSTRVTRVDSTFGLWAREIARETRVPFVDLNNITASKYERFGKEKTKTMFYLDRIHTSVFGARENALSAVEGIASLDDCDLKDYLRPASVDSVTGSSRRGDRPVSFIIGDSTVKIDSVGDNTMWGWGDLLAGHLDSARISVENHAKAGHSARTFIEEGRWDKIYNALRPGDFVLIQFGHNDGGDIASGNARGELPGTSGESKVFKMERGGDYRVVYTYGWYLRKFIDDARSRGAIPVIISPAPRNRRSADGKIESLESTFAGWARDVAARRKADFVDLNARSGEKLNRMPADTVALLFHGDHTHSSRRGATLNAASVAEGIEASGGALASYLRPRVMSFDLSSVGPYTEERGYGWDFGTRPAARSGEPFIFSTRLPRDGNYRVTVELGSKKQAASTSVRAESRRLMAEEVATRHGETKTISFNVAKRSPVISTSARVKINPREVGTPTWDDKLTLEFTGSSPAAAHVTVEPLTEADSVTTIFLCGNSTVVDQTYEPWASWGQIVPRYFDSGVVVANHAESGESARSFIDKKRLDKVLSMARPGDWMIIEFGHNDQKQRSPGSGAWYNFSTNLKIFIDRARRAGVNPVLVTPACRRSFDAEGHVRDTHLDYPDAIRAVAEREGVPLIDLNAMTKTLYEALGTEGSKQAFVHYPAGTFRGQTTALEDNTHFNPYGATQIAKIILQTLKTTVPALGEHIIDFPDYDPATPDDPSTFYWPEAIFIQLDRPYGS